MIRFGYAFSSGFFTLYAWTRRKHYEIQWFRGEGIRAFAIPFGEFRLTLDGQLKAREVAMDEAAGGGDST